MEIYGYKVVVQQPHQKISLSSKVMVSDKFRKEMNDYLAANFGYIETIDDGKALKFEAVKTIAVNQKTYDRLEKELRADDLHHFRKKAEYQIHNAMNVPSRFL